ncbi:YncE family protein [Prescottella subtropica]|uniref:YncE family protein n=1 Tax=Prescottella subtropica TaxID=2545757 RepID=UPI0010F9C6FE|nr:hypothetical protein [Prescottella subtropica]
MRISAPRVTAVAIGVALLLTAGCSTEQGGDDLKTIPVATAADSPAALSPAGTVENLGRSIDALVFDPSTNTTAILVDGGTRVLLQTAGTPTREVALDGTAAQLTLAPEGRLLAPMDGEVQIVDIVSGIAGAVSTSTSSPIDGDARSAAFLDDGRLAVGLADGRIQVLAGIGGETETISGLASVDALAVTGDDLSALDRGQTSLTEIDLGDSKLGLALRAGEGATNLVTDEYGRILVVDTRGGELLVFTADELIMRQRYPVAGSPYGIAYDERTDLAWVTRTADNTVVGFDLSTGIPVEKMRFDTVRQPNSVAVDTAGGALLVGSATGDGLQRIPLAG